MHFILGGKNQGKLNWYLTRNHATIEDVADGETMALDVLPEQAVINHLHRWIFAWFRTTWTLFLFWNNTFRNILTQ